MNFPGVSDHSVLTRVTLAVTGPFSHQAKKSLSAVSSPSASILTFRLYIDEAIRVIHHKTGDVHLPCRPIRGIAKSDTAHVAVDL